MSLNMAGDVALLRGFRKSVAAPSLVSRAIRFFQSAIFALGCAPSRGKSRSKIKRGQGTPTPESDEPLGRGGLDVRHSAGVVRGGVDRPGVDCGEQETQKGGKQTWRT